MVKWYVWPWKKGPGVGEGYFDLREMGAELRIDEGVAKTGDQVINAPHLRIPCASW